MINDKNSYGMQKSDMQKLIAPLYDGGNKMGKALGDLNRKVALINKSKKTYTPHINPNRAIKLHIDSPTLGSEGVGLHDADGENPPINRRRGRPPGSKNKPKPIIEGEE
jgi:hypothetical protein